jgi:hypothetical protein
VPQCAPTTLDRQATVRGAVAASRTADAASTARRARLGPRDGAELGGVDVDAPRAAEADAEHGANHAGDVQLSLTGRPPRSARMDEIVAVPRSLCCTAATSPVRASGSPPLL